MKKAISIVAIVGQVTLASPLMAQDRAPAPAEAARPPERLITAPIAEGGRVDAVRPSTQPDTRAATAKQRRTPSRKAVVLTTVALVAVLVVMIATGNCDGPSCDLHPRRAGR